MPAAEIFERFSHTPYLALSVVDAMARALRVTGEFPPLLGEISCEIVEATAPAQRTFDPPRVLYTFRNRSGYIVLDGTYTTIDDLSRRWPLGPGTYRVRVRGDFYQDGEFLLPWPPAADQRRIPIPQPNPNNAHTLALLPSTAYPLPDVTLGRLQLGPTMLRGAAFSSDGTPIAGAVAEINLPILQPANLPPLGDWPFLKATSDAGGNWALVLPGRRYIDNTPEIPPTSSPPIRKQIAVQIEYRPGQVITTVQDVLLGSEHPVRNTALRGQVLGPGGRPIVGARIRTSVSAATSTSRRDGVWFLYFDLNQGPVASVSVTATTPDGASATDSTAVLQPEATVVVPTFNFS